MSFPKILEVNQNTEKRNIYALLLKLKSFFVYRLESFLPKDHAALAGGILLGTKASLGKDLIEMFRKVGLIHIVVLSGYNVTLITNTIQRLLQIFPRSIAFIGSLISIVLFAMLVGASATTVRASLMAAVLVCAWYLRKTYQVHRALFLAALLMMVQNPMIAFYDPGFQLSFVATLGLLFLSPKIEIYLSKIKIPEMFEIRAIVAATIATQIAVLPLLIYMTGSVSLIALFANMLVLPMIPLAMLFSALLIISPDIISEVLQMLSYFYLQYVLSITVHLSKIPFAEIFLLSNN